MKPDVVDMILVSFLPLLFLSVVQAQIYVGYYDFACPWVEDIVRSYVEEAVLVNPGIAAGLVHMHFHDCFVRGCDGSILLDSVPGSGILAEKDHPANKLSFRGGEVIDKAKARLEEVCPGQVSCADILSFAARDSVNIVGGPSWAVAGGRRDGRVSRSTEVVPNLAAPSFNLAQLTQTFAAKGLSQDDVVTLSGAHTIGHAHCIAFMKRLYNFSTAFAEDPSLDEELAARLKLKCPNVSNPDANTVVAMDTVTAEVFDNKYYVNVEQGRGLFSSDEALLSEEASSQRVSKNARDEALWFRSFGDAMIRMSLVDVKTGADAEIRWNCHFVNRIE